MPIETLAVSDASYSMSKGSAAQAWVAQISDIRYAVTVCFIGVSDCRRTRADENREQGCLWGSSSENAVAMPPTRICRNCRGIWCPLNGVYAEQLQWYHYQKIPCEEAFHLAERFGAAGGKPPYRG